MKEVTYTDWVKNPTPRMMWVWDSNEDGKRKQKVIYFRDPRFYYPVITLTDDGLSTDKFKHCAEIGELRRMTHRELARWLCEKPFREFKYGSGTNCPVYKYHTYTEDEASREVCKDIVIREDDGKWKVPLVEIE